MAQGRVAIASSSASNASANASSKRVHDIQQYNKIVQFGDAVLSGKHPSLKPPPGLLALSQSSSRSNPSIPQTNGQKTAQAQLANENIKTPAPAASSDALAVKRKMGSAKTEINPILLEKSDELIRAEIQLQRQRLERGLREEFEKRRGSKHEKAEPMADVDLSDVLVKALTLVQATAGPLHQDENISGTNEAASDSFDDNTFYSSQHDTPESQLLSRVSATSPTAHDAQEPHSTLADYADLYPSVSDPDPPHVARPSDPHTENPTNLQETRHQRSNHPGGFHVPGLNNYPSDAIPPTHQGSNNAHREQALPGGLGITEREEHGKQYERHADSSASRAYVDDHPPSPLIRSYDLMPVAPQPARVSRLAVEEPLTSPGNQGTRSSRVAPAQVAALRTEVLTVESPESSPQNGKGPEKKRSRKKKRKADRQAPEDVMPYIKPEPRSPSPLNVPTSIRPTKRQRQSQRQANEPDQEELNVTHDSQQQPESRLIHGESAAVPYGVAEYHPRASSTAMITERRHDKDYNGDRGVPRDVYIQHQPSPPRYVQRAPSTAYSTRPIVIDDGYREPPPYPYRDPYEVSRMSARPEFDSYEQRRLPPTRIIVDSFGREYIEPPRPAVRQSVAPTMSHGEPDILYDRPPPRAVSRHVGPPAYEEPGLVYPRASSAYPTPRRIMTQPERISQEYGEVRPREYSVRPMGPPGEYMQAMPPPHERRVADEGRREFATRGASARPPEPVRYEMPREYGRVQSVRPDVRVHEYAGSGHPEARREAAQPFVADYGPRQVQQPMLQGGYGARPMERYYEPPTAGAGEGTTYIERPRAMVPETVYVDETGREIYP